MPLVNGSESFERWHKMDEIPIKFNVFVFNVTNSEDVRNNKTDKIEVKEIGPYVFRELKHKDILDMNNTEITYVPRNAYYFQAEDSLPLSLSDKFVFPNPPLFVSYCHSVTDPSVLNSNYVSRLP